MELTLEVIEATKVIQLYLEDEGRYTLTVDEHGGVTIKSYLGSHYEYMSPTKVNAQLVELQDEAKGETGETADH